MRTHVLKCKVVNASVDWITCTSSTKDAKGALWNVGYRMLDRAEGEGEQTTAWHAHGYDGWTNGPVTLGARKDGCILRISGQQAGYQWLKAFAAAENCSRLDLAVDCELDRPVTTLARQIYQDVRHVRPSNGRPPTRSLILSGDGGSTVYVGARSSEQFGRVYDKGVQSKTCQAGTWWRWEVELKGRQSWAHAGALRSVDDHQVLLCATVAHWFRSRTHHTYTSSSKSPSILLSTERSSVDRQLLWLSQGVRPTVQRLVDRLGRDRIMFALGLLPQSAVSVPELMKTHKEVA